MSAIKELYTKLRTATYDHFVANGNAPTIDALAKQTGITQQAIEAALREMEQEHILVLQEDTAEILMAIPFSAVPTSFKVDSGGVDYWANCMWDALGIPAALHQDSRIVTQCQDCGEEMMLSIESGQLQGDQGVVHFILPPKQWWDDIVFT